MSEAVLQADLQRELQSLTSTFASADVTINDTAVLEAGSVGAPFAVVESADDFEMEDIDTQWLVTWQIPFVLYVYFTDADAAQNALTSLRDTVMTKLKNKEGFNASSSKLSYGLRSVRAGTPIEYIYDSAKVQAAEDSGNQPPLPEFAYQRLIARVAEIQVG